MKVEIVKIVVSRINLTFTSCHMYSIAFSVSTEGFTCDKCRETVRLSDVK